MEGGGPNREVGASSSRGRKQKKCKEGRGQWGGEAESGDDGGRGGTCGLI